MEKKALTKEARRMLGSGYDCFSDEFVMETVKGSFMLDCARLRVAMSAVKASLLTSYHRLMRK